jgi:signal transduction histidine kinase
MLHEFLADNRQELARLCRAKAAARSKSGSHSGDASYGIPLFIDQLIDTLRLEALAGPNAAHAEVPAVIGDSAEKHGNDLLLKGYTVDQVVHDYGDVCQSLTELARERNVPITVGEFHTFNRCLDNAMAGAVTEFGRQRDQFISAEGNQTMNERLGCLAHEQRNLLSSAMLAFHAISSGRVAIHGATGTVLRRSLLGLRDLIDGALADVRLTRGLELKRVSISLHALLAEIQVSAAMDAETRGLTFTVSPVDTGLMVEADRQMLISAITNLLQNAFKFTKPGGHVLLSALASAEHVLIEIEDRCGGLAEGQTERLFQPFEQDGSDRTGVGLGLSISRRAVEANGGRIRVRNMPTIGCIFIIELPRAARAAFLQV